MPTLRPLLLLLCLLFIRTAWCLDLCSNFEDEAADSFVHQSATPKGGAGAGVYTRDVAATSLTTCLVSCCESTSCQTLFFHKDTCYLIRCNSTDSCSPVARTEAKFKNSFLVIVRSVGPSQSPLSDVLSHLDVHSECSPDSEGGCLANEVCTFELQETFVGYVCECDQGFTYDAHSNRCTADFVPASCEIGLVGQCPKHERCQGKNKRSRQGVCRCVEGYARDEASGWCENEHLKTREKIKDESTVASTPITSTSKSPPPTSSMLLPSTPPSSTVRPKGQMREFTSYVWSLQYKSLSQKFPLISLTFFPFYFTYLEQPIHVDLRIEFEFDMSCVEVMWEGDKMLMKGAFERTSSTNLLDNSPGSFLPFA
ncbi:hypothetical protein CAPTEDRAFT_186078 [Capitella teleta]|uniref:EGF-like domain-containing protein n=1 Tax=Capitella teleta TaxID=283909 RepID=R7TG76_CAPTE|nr:hypothetical protein CAPTEDRAFT_186078 [Capitella teleta]|eukprot:ELT92487.1 hypothetical protein CAPTEDRAFT_186078 [Capitella teleta]